MTADRWQQIERLYHAAIARVAGERAAFLHDACAGDDALQREVQSLLDHEDEAQQFLSTPAFAAVVPSGASVALTVGRKIGAYTIVSALGSGGMGEVYRARDTKLGREVAIKILPGAFTADPEQRARFAREARLLASLNHPHIAQVYGFDDVEGVSVLVLELVEGKTLDEIIAGAGGPEGPPLHLSDGALGLQARGLPVSAALSIARQMADALDAAHEKGIIHRDLKPANVKVTPDGMVKVLDFGLAKAVTGDASGPDRSQMPPVTPEGTRAGVVLGTPAYMSPEQARGKPVDKRTDIWAFGCVLYEMLTGRRPFPGETTPDTIAAILEREPDWSVLPSNTPAKLRGLLDDCLTRDPKQRLRDIGAARIAIDRLLGGAPDDIATPTAPAINAAPLWRRAFPWVAAAIATAVAGALLVTRGLERTVPSSAPLHLSVDIGTDASLVVTGLTNLAPAAVLSPDGTTLAFSALGGGGHPQLYVRKLDQLRAAALSDTEDAYNPFFSPDGQWIGFFAGDKLKKVDKLKKISVSGGTAVTLCELACPTSPCGRGASWSEDGTIIFQPRGVSSTNLERLSEIGGTPEPLSTPVEGAQTVRWPQVLPGGKAVLYTAHTSLTNFDSANLIVQALPSGAPKVVFRGGYHGRYVSSGHIIYMHDGTLFAVPFDLVRLETTGRPAPVLAGVRASPGNAGAQFAFSATGTLVYVPGTADFGLAVGPIDWMDRTGKLSPLRAVADFWLFPRFDPVGRRLAMVISDGKQFHIWIDDLAHETVAQLTFDAADDLAPVWSPDGRGLVFASDRGHPGVYNLYWKFADGTGDIQRLTDSEKNQTPWSWHPSGRFLAITEKNRGTSRWDVAILPMDESDLKAWRAGKPEGLQDSPSGVLSAMFSPDGRWIAYTSDGDVYVRPFRGHGGPWMVSAGGGSWPTWSPKRNELFYGTPENKIMVVPYLVDGDAFSAGKAMLWSPTGYVSGGAGRPFDLDPIDQRFAVKPIEQRADETHDKVVFIFNFFEELRRVAPATKR